MISINKTVTSKQVGIYVVSICLEIHFQPPVPALHLTNSQLYQTQILTGVRTEFLLELPSALIGG